MQKLINCIECGRDFIIIPTEDGYLKDYDLPLPKKCPRCRKKEREEWLYTPLYTETQCDICKKNVLIPYRSTNGRSVLCSKCKYEQRIKYGNPKTPYNPSKSFFQQFKDLLLQFPITGIDLYENENHNKNSTRSYEISFCNNTIDSFDLSKCFNSVCVQNAISTTNCVDCTFTNRCENSFELVSCDSCYFSSNSVDCEDCKYIQHCDNCIRCENCFGCSGLRDKKYHIFNKKFNKEDYEKQISELNSLRSEALTTLLEDNKKDIPVPSTIQFGKNEDSIYGSNISGCKSCYYVFHLSYSQNTSYTWHGQNNESSLDLSLSRKCEFCYMCSDSSFCNRCFYCTDCYECNNVYYSYKGYKLNNCFGCISISEKKYHILNQPYEKDDYFEIISGIKDELNLHYHA